LGISWNRASAWAWISSNVTARPDISGMPLPYGAFLKKF
jgi:hypothetical protein